MKKDKKNFCIKKKKIWPSVVAFISFILIGWFVVMTIVLFITGKIVDNKISDKKESLKKMSTYVASRLWLDDDAENVLKEMEEAGEYSAIFIMDQTGGENGYGEFTPYLDDSFIHENDNEFVVYYDKEFLSDDNIEAITEYISGNLFSFFINNVKETWDSDSANITYNIPIWFSSRLNDGNTIYIKDECIITLREIALVFNVAFSVIIIYSLMIIFMIIFFVKNVRSRTKIINLLYKDSVTGKYNWTYYKAYVGRYLSKRKNLGNYIIADVSVCKFRNFCICHGLKEGEEMLARIHTAINECLNKKELCVHYEKSDFALFLKGDIETIEGRLKRIEAALTSVGVHNLHIHTGVFVVSKKERKESVDVVNAFTNASAAELMLKDENVTQYCIFDSSMLEDEKWEHDVSECMQRALDNEEFVVYYQPKYNPVTEELSGAEALIRWISEEKGFVSPGRFIPIFEKNGFIVNIDDYMVSHVAKQQSEWLKNGVDIVPVSVNISRAHFMSPDLAEHICELVDEYDLPHEFIEIELTESAFFDDKEALFTTVRKLQGYGFAVSMDDFGSGCSSLNSLRELPLNVLKLDAEFFRGDEGTEERSRIVVEEAIHLAKSLNMTIVAEGIENKAQVDFLAQTGCDMIQGYYYAKPMPADEYSERMHRMDE